MHTPADYGKSVAASPLPSQRSLRFVVHAQPLIYKPLNKGESALLSRYPAYELLSMLVAAVKSCLQFARPQSFSANHSGWLLTQLRCKGIHWEVPGLNVVMSAGFWSTPVRDSRCSLINNGRIRQANRRRRSCSCVSILV